ncbi:MAG: M23 family metallopeptidase [Candidatus Omnitrophica bacterium]|nr:M23 family metallopeptidase [Candidatus Omnitrophota bacterium]
MKRPLRICLAISFIAIVIFAIQAFLFPLFYRIKEPYFAMPIEIDRKIEITADLPIRNDVYGDGEFGAKRRGGRKHKGLDLAAKLKSPVYASKSGWAKAFSIPSGYGELIVINHPGGWQTRYGHLYTIAIKKSQWVWQGGIIGCVGKSGNANSRGIIPHLHFEIRYKDQPIDPAKELLKQYVEKQLTQGGTL